MLVPNCKDAIAKLSWDEPEMVHQVGLFAGHGWEMRSDTVNKAPNAAPPSRHNGVVDVNSIMQPIKVMQILLELSTLSRYYPGTILLVVLQYYLTDVPACGMGSKVAHV